jgi:F420-non-reducing hydrogenase large subunit
VLVKEINFDGLRGLDEQIRVKIVPNQGPPQVFLQITSPRDFAGLCLGRPVEELPRILTILSPAHHLASALALDNLFRVEPPPLAVNMREALLHTLFFENHLRKFYFLISAGFNPFLPTASREKEPKGVQSSPHILDEIMGHIALSQEAITILGGRSDHPLSSVAGGVSRYLPKEENFERLSQIAKSCLAFAQKLGKFLHQEFLGKDQGWSDLAEISLVALSFMSLPAASDAIILKDGQGKELDKFSPEMLSQKIGLHREPWSYEPFAFLKNSSGGRKLKDLVGIEDLSYDQCFFVGPLARLNQDSALTPLAEEERQRLIKGSGSLPRFDLPAAFWSLFLELLMVGEKMAELVQKEKLLGPETRTIPTAMGHEGRAVLESPRGLLYHHYTVDEKGLVKDIEVLDTATENNVLRCLLAQKTTEIALTRNYTSQEMKQFLELVLLPF